MEWKKVKLKSIFKQYRIEHRVQDDIVYKQVTISKHTGVSFRGEKLGKEIGRKRQFVIDLDLHPHTLMFVRQGVQDGSIGFAPLEVNKCIVTENMPMFSVEDVDVEFIKSYIESSLFKDILNSLSTKGAAQKSIHEKELLEVEILIPESLEDQKAFGKLIKDSTKNSNNISTEITHQLDLIKNLRQAFLREAMQGLLVSNETSDDKTGADLLAEIQAEKAQLVKEKKIKKPKPLAPIMEDEIPFDIPENWTWCKVGDLSYSIVPNRDKPKSFTGHIPWITQTNFSEKSFYLDYSLTDKGLSIEETNLYNCRVMPKHSIVMSCVGRFDLVCLLDKPIVANQQLHCFVPFSNLSPKYLAYSIKQFSNLLIDKAIKTTISYINKEKCESIFIPLPPLETQERIVAKLDELMSNCDALEEQVKQSQQTNELLLQQVLREALGDKKEINNEVGVSVNKYAKIETNYDALVAETFGEYLPQKVHHINDTHKELAALVYLMNNGLGANYGNVAFQKAVYNSSVIAPNLYSKKHDFINYNFGTYSKELADDLSRNPYLKTKKIGDKKVYEIEPSKKNEILNLLSSPVNKDFVLSINKLIDLYRLPFINKETNKMELLNTVLKIHSDLKTTDIEIIYQAMKDWKIKQDKYSTKAEKFSKRDTEKMIELLIANGIL